MPPGARKKKTPKKKSASKPMDTRLEAAAAHAIAAFTESVLADSSKVRTARMTGKRIGFSVSGETNDGKKFRLSITQQG